MNSAGKRQYSVLIFLALIIGAMLSPAWASATSLSAQVDRSTIEMGETLNLRVRFEGAQAREEPAFSSLRDQFEILSNQKSVQTNIVNNQVRMHTEWALTLAPKSAGQVLIPPFTVQGETSAPITIRVNEASVDPNSGKQDVFLETQIEKTEGHVQEQFLLTYRLYFNRRVDQLEMGDFNIENARLEELPRVDFQRTIGDTQYGVAEFRYAVFPTSSGTLSIPSATWTVRTVDQPAMGRFRSSGQFRLHRVSTDALELNIASRPGQYPAGQPWLPASDVQLEDNWSHSLERLKVGEPITRSVTVRAKGVNPEQLPPVFDTDSPAGFRFYPDQPNQNKYTDADGIIGVRTESVAIVPNRSGELTLPPVEITWWDTSAQAVKTAALPAKTVTVAAATDGRGQAISDEPERSSQTSPTASESGPAEGSTQGTMVWQLSTAFLGLLSLLFAGLWWRGRTTPPEAQANTRAPNQQRSAEALREAVNLCRENDPMALKQALLRWAALHWPEQPYPTLDSIAARSDDPAFTEALKQLDAQLYAKHKVEVDNTAIAQGLKKLAAQSKTHQTQLAGALKPLYAGG